MSYRITKLKPGDEFLAEDSIKNVWTPYGSLSSSKKYLTKFLADEGVEDVNEIIGAARRDRAEISRTVTCSVLRGIYL